MSHNRAFHRQGPLRQLTQHYKHLQGRFSVMENNMQVLRRELAEVGERVAKLASGNEVKK